MTLSELSIKRPVFATVLCLLTVVFGVASLLGLPIRELPDIDYAVVTVSVGYEGAAPGIIDTEIVEAVEGAIAGIAGIKTISSSSRRGRGRTVIEFEPSRNIDEAANDVRDAVGRIRGRLPEDADEPRITKSDDDDDPVMRIGITSDRMDPTELTDYAERFIVDRLATLGGVAAVDIFGQRRYAVRIWLDRQAMAARNLTVDDVEAALNRNNIELPAGELRSRSRQFQLRTVSRLGSIDEFRSIVISRLGDYPIRLDDIARVERGAEDDQTVVRSNGDVAIGLGVLRQSSSNTIAIAQAIEAELEAIRPTLPEGMTIEIGSNDALFIEQSIKEVLKALAIAMALVVLVIFCFLASIRATLIPAVTIPVAIIGAFIGIQAFGFSINVLTLLALILAIGIVVDDAIVVLENVQRRIDLGEMPLVAGVLGTRQVTFAVIATSITLIAVFVPISFMDGQVGRLFTEFGIVLAIAVVISTIVALSLCPMLCTKWLRAEHESRSTAAAVRRGIHVGLDQVGGVYRRLLTASLRAPLIVLTVALLMGAASYWLYLIQPKELAPTEDRGVFFVSIGGPQGATASYTDEETRKVEAIIEPLLDDGTAKRVFAMVGRGSSPHRSFVVVRLADWAKRDQSSQAISRSLMPELGKLNGVRAVAIAPSGLGLYGSRTPLRIVVGGPDYESVQTWANELVTKAETNPGLRDLDVDFERNQPQFDVLIDRQRADDLNISTEQIARTLQTMLASREITSYVERGREYDVILQAEETDRRTPADLANIFVRSGERGEEGATLVPLGALVTTEERAAAPTLRRYDRLPSVTITGSLNDGYDLGRAIIFMQKIAKETLPLDAKLGYAGQTAQYLETTSGVALTFGLALLIVYLVLAAQFESFIHPLIIMITLPLATSGALFTLWLGNASLNIYSQVGLILLVGLTAKNGILIVEFANQLRDEGRTIREAVIEASVLRLRPIVMTVLSTMLGAIPLVLATGAGAESREAIGLVIIGGLGIASLMTLIVTPVLYDLLARFTKPAGTIERELAKALASRSGVGG